MVVKKELPRFKKKEFNPAWCPKCENPLSSRRVYIDDKPIIFKNMCIFCKEVHNFSYKYFSTAIPIDNVKMSEALCGGRENLEDILRANPTTDFFTSDEIREELKIQAKAARGLIDTEEPEVPFQ